MEFYKSETLPAIYKSIGILSRYPLQVVVLKSTRSACGLVGNGEQMRERLVDRDQTAAFPQFCKHAALAQLGDSRWQRALLKRVAAARTDLNTFGLSIRSITTARKEVAATYSKSDIRVIRSGIEMPSTLKARFVENVMDLARSMLRSHPEVTALPSFDELPNRYLFRFASCVQVWILDWLAKGSPDTVKSAKITNDLLDLHIATCATFFDGLLSHDEKLTRIYSTVRAMLRQIA